MSTAVEVTRPRAEIIDHTPPPAITPMVMVERALASGAGIDVLERLMSLNERYEASIARKAFDSAMASAKAEIPVIIKSRKVDFTTQKGRTNYRYEDLGEIARTVDPILSKYGLSYRFTTETAGGSVTVTCVVSHREGHSERNTLSGAHDQSGNKNSIQAVGSTITYLQRYTLKAALGLAAAADDDGGKSEQATEEATVITEAQASVVRELIEKAELEIDQFCGHWNVEAIREIPSAKFNDVVGSLRRRIAVLAEKKKEQTNG